MLNAVDETFETDLWHSPNSHLAAAKPSDQSNSLLRGACQAYQDQADQIHQIKSTRCNRCYTEVSPAASDCPNVPTFEVSGISNKSSFLTMWTSQEASHHSQDMSYLVNSPERRPYVTEADTAISRCSRLADHHLQPRCSSPIGTVLGQSSRWRPRRSSACGNDVAECVDSPPSQATGMCWPCAWLSSQEKLRMQGSCDYMPCRRHSQAPTQIVARCGSKGLGLKRTW